MKKDMLNMRQRVKPHLDDLKARKITNREVAKILGCNEQALSRLLGTIEFERDPPVDHAAHRELVRTRKEHLAQCAATMTPEQAAKACNVSVRTIYRYVDKAKKEAAIKSEGAGNGP